MQGNSDNPTYISTSHVSLVLKRDPTTAKQSFDCNWFNDVISTTDAIYCQRYLWYWENSKNPAHAQVFPL